MHLLVFIIILGIDASSGRFLPDTSDHDAYGLKIAGNDAMIIEAFSDTQQFLIRTAPYNDTSHSLECSITYNYSTQYVYSVGIGKKQNSKQLHFFYAGEVIPDNVSATDSSDHSYAFIGILVNKKSERTESFNCSYFEYQSLQFISSYGHQEFFVFGVEPYGQFAIGLAKDFVFIYQPFSHNIITTKNSSLVWPANTIFMPVAIDTHISFTIVAGFVVNGPWFRVRATPTVYVISNSDLNILATWSYTAAINSWQSHLTYSNLKTWSNNYVMSVSINFDDPTQVLVGMPFLNIVFLLIVNLNGSNLMLGRLIDNGDSIGFGKSVTWLSNTQVAILSSNHPTNDSSKIYLYTSLTNTTLLSLSSAVFPNIQQTLPTTVNARFIRMISTSTSLAILGIYGEILLIVSALPGYFASTRLSIIDSIFIISQPIMCMAGTYKADTSIFPCSLCPSGSRNPGNLTAFSCMTCLSDSFCPMGAVADIDATLLLPRSQASVHPRSPEVTVFDEILLQNMFSTSSRKDCVFIAPLFWVFIMISFIIIILFVMGILKTCVPGSKSQEVRGHVKKIFRQTDLINEGEMWVGGLVSFAIIVLLLFAYSFSAAFYQEYPSDGAGRSTFTCGETIRNVKYESGLQSLSIPVSEEEQPMFNLLNKQTFTLRLDLLNTILTCESLSVQQIFGSSTTKLIPTCTDSIGILSTAIKLPYQRMIIEWILNDIELVGAIRVSLSADEKQYGFYRLKELDFSQTFYDGSNRTLALSSTINLELTKAINETEPLTGHKANFSGLWYPKFVIDGDHMFISSAEYVTMANLRSTKLTMVLSETSYYIKNHQSPIAKLREIIFHNLLFTVVCLEIFRLITLVCRLTILPLFSVIMQHFQGKKEILSTNIGSVDHDIITSDHDTTIDNHSTTVDNHSLTTDNHSTTADNHSVTTDNHSTTADNHSITTKDYHVVQVNV
ncbi:unnamed protein product [Rotaria sp. Silwood2]|nr:unnamed protein product [Rotaria sp. Silwood2]CAF2797324.1 unnamed protein product [Rotaria sp. Silwood2]CAF3891146.1 unnamed protein product [Rotaria sp. Silwood2]CAF3998704.1 unnamed protein product [Rotaria sp. Silwood2]